MPDDRSKALRLLDYLKALAQIRSKVIYDVAKYERC